MSNVPARAVLVASSLVVATAASAGVAAPPSGVVDAVGRLHPFLVHFPVALLIVAGVAELLCVIQRDGRYADVARFMVAAAAWVGVPAAIAGLARANSITIPPELEGAFAIHRVAGLVTPVLAFLATGLATGVRRSGQIWELFLYRIVLILAVGFAATAGYYGGELAYGAGFFPRW